MIPCLMNVVLGRKRRTPSAGQGRWSGNPQMCLRQGNGREARQVVCCFSMKFYFFFPLCSRLVIYRVLLMKVGSLIKRLKYPSTV